MGRPGKNIRVVILGAGGHARVIADALLNPALRRQGYELIGFLDDNPALLNERILGRPVLGFLDDLAKVPHDAVVIGLGDNESRFHLFERLASRGEQFATIIHPSAIIAPNALVGVGTVIFGGVVVNSAATIGDDVILNTACTVDHDCIIGSHSHICPGVHLGGTVRVGKGAWVGIGSTVLHNRTVGEWATIGGGAAVIKQVPANTTVVGVPAKALPPRPSRQRPVYDFRIDAQPVRQGRTSGGRSSPEPIAPENVSVREPDSALAALQKRQDQPVVNTLFTSAGRRVELLRAFRSAYDSLGLAGRIVALDVDPLAPCLSSADRSYVVPSLSSPDYIPALEEICRKERIRLVFPLIDPDITLLAEHRERIERTGAEVVVLRKDSVAITADKWLTQKFFNEVGVPNPRSWLPEELDPETAPYPLFIKPRRGSAGKDSFKVENAEQLRFFSKYIPEPIIEDFLTGPEITNDVVCDLKGTVLAVVSRKRIEVRSGEVAKGVTIFDEQIMKACVRIVEALGGKGQITVQCIMKEDLPYFTEINARFGGGTPLGIACGCDAPRWLLAEAAGLPVEVPPIGSYKVGLHVTRFDESYFLTEHDRETIACNSIRS